MSKYILWDLDGTLVESEDVAFKSEIYRHAGAKLNLAFHLEPEELAGHEGRTIFPLLLERNKITDAENHAALYNEWYEEVFGLIFSHADKIEPRENVCEIWRKCTEKGIKHAVVTSNRSDVAMAYLKKINLLPLCETLVCIDDVSEPKPSPMPYLTALKKLNISRKDCLAVEDSVPGITSAAKANIYTIAWVKDSSHPKFSIADFVTNEIDEELLIQKLGEAENGSPFRE